MSDTPENSMMNLFSYELEAEVGALTQGLLALEKDPTSKNSLELLMRAAHSIKGAAKVVNLDSVVKLAHALEDFLVAVQKEQVRATPERIDIALKAVDHLLTLSTIRSAQITNWHQENALLLAESVVELEGALLATALPQPFKAIEDRQAKSTAPAARIIRLSTQQLNLFMGMSAELLVQSLWLQPYLENLIRSKKELIQTASEFEQLSDQISPKNGDEIIGDKVRNLEEHLNLLTQRMSAHISELEMFIRRHLNLSLRFYDGMLSSRMRPFSDAMEGFPRMVRDMARELGKKVKLEIVGQATPVDRDILEKLEVPLSHLVRNAIDHGIENPNERIAAGKPEEGTLRIEASQRAGMLAITVSDDGKGIEIETLRKKIIETNLVTPEAAREMKDDELLDYLFLPGFSTSQSVTEISGRGIGLNVVKNMINQVGGVVKIKYIPKVGTTFFLNMPLTLSVMRAFIVEIGGEPYALPLLRIEKALLIHSEELQEGENGRFIDFQGKKIAVISAGQLLEVQGEQTNNKTLSIIVLSENLNTYGLIVDRFLDEKELVVRELDPLLGKISDVAAGAILPDGTPALILDVDELLRSVQPFLTRQTQVSP
jgi:two-component system, chemotaxis family, sensor histidine kinase and response regulator WspE